MVRLGLSEIQGTSCLGGQLSETSCQGMNCQRVSWRSVKKSTESRTCHRRKPDLRVGHNFEIVFFRQVAFLHLGRKNSSRSKVSIEIRKERSFGTFFWRGWKTFFLVKKIEKTRFRLFSAFPRFSILPFWHYRPHYLMRYFATTEIFRWCRNSLHSFFLGERKNAISVMMDCF